MSTPDPRRFYRSDNPDGSREAIEDLIESGTFTKHERSIMFYLKKWQMKYEPTCKEQWPTAHQLSDFMAWCEDIHMPLNQMQVSRRTKAMEERGWINSETVTVDNKTQLHFALGPSQRYQQEEEWLQDHCPITSAVKQLRVYREHSFPELLTHLEEIAVNLEKQRGKDHSPMQQYWLQYYEHLRASLRIMLEDNYARGNSLAPDSFDIMGVGKNNYYER